MWFFRFYRLLLLSYPAAFRRDHGREAAHLFADACHESLRERRHVALLARIGRACVEVPVRGLVEHARDRSLAGISTLAAEVPSNLRETFRSLMRTPAFTITAILTMTIGIALNTAMFTAFNAVALRGWPGVDAARVVTIRPAAWDDRGLLSGLDLEDLRQLQRSQSLEHVAATRPAYLYAATEARGRADLVYGRFATADFFATVGISMARGRAFTADEDLAGAAAPVVVISHALWHRMFAGAEDVIGRSLHFGKAAHRIIGVTPEQWRGEQPYRDDVWLPLQAIRVLDPDDRLFAGDGAGCCVKIIGRLAEHASTESTAEELSVLTRPRRSQSDQPPWRILVGTTARFDQLSPSFKAGVTAVLFAATALVLLLTGANITHLQLARAATRAREIRTRLALGAGRFRISRQLAIESLVLATIAGFLALGLVYALLGTLMRVSELPVVEIWRPDLTVFLYCLCVSVVMSLTFGLLPALRATKISLVHGGGHSSTPIRLRSNLLLLTTQIALSVTLLAGAALLTRGLRHATTADAGFAVEGLTVFSVQPGRLGDGARMRTPEFRDALRHALSASTLPPSAFVDVLPLINQVTTQIPLGDDTDPARLRVGYAPMSASAFDVFGIPIIEGRPYDDRSDAEVVINQTAARRLWPTESALGRSVPVDGRPRVVTGITRDVHYLSRADVGPTIHVPSNPAASTLTFVMRAEGAAVESQIRTVVRSLDPHATVTARSLIGILEDVLTDERVGSQAAWAGGLLALALATFGVFGVFVYVAEERRREIGIRIALGAQRRDVLGTLFRPARLAVLAGLALGLLMSLALAPAIERNLYGLSAFDPVAFVTVAAIISAAALVATVVPARRALSVDPVVILKAD
jgi:putative ABC transport system permease protein